jgi:hypothetical protein
MFIRAMDVDVEIFWRVQLLLQSCMLLRGLCNVYLSPIWPQELAEVLFMVVGALSDCCAG